MVTVASRDKLKENLLGVTRETHTLLQKVGNEINRILVRNSLRNGLIDPKSLPQIETDITRVITQEISPQNRAYTWDYRPLSPLAKILNKWLVKASMDAIWSHMTEMDRMVPDDLKDWLNQTRMGVGHPREGAIQDPTTRWEHPHEWVDRNNRILSERIPIARDLVIVKVLDLVRDRIKKDKTGLEIGREVLSYVIPGKTIKSGQNIHGLNVSYRIMNLTRSEVVRAFSMMHLAAAYANPTVNGMEWMLSILHPRTDICDDLATVGMSGQRLREPYDLNDAPIVIVHSHPLCLCVNSPVVATDLNPIWNQLRRRRDDDHLSYLTPYAPLLFFRFMMGEYLYNVAIGEEE